VDLTSRRLIAIVGLVTVAALVAAVITWPRLAVQRPRWVVARVAVLLAVNVLVLATIGLSVNRHYGFFAGWRDLASVFGSTPSYKERALGGSAADAAATTVAGPSLTQAHDGPPLSGAVVGARQRTFTVKGAVSGVTGQVVVQLPQGYGDPGTAQRRYPVIEAFHGYPGVPEQWLTAMDLGRAIDREVQQGRMTSAVIVAPQLQIPSERDTECVDGGNGQPAMETWLTVDIPQWVANTFRVRLDRSSWAAVGMSSGGWCAAMAALLHPDRYGISMVFAGYFSPDFEESYVPFGPSSSEALRYDLVQLVRQAPPPTAMWVLTSRSDTVSYQSSARFLAAVRAPLSVRVVEFGLAGHSAPVWSPLVPSALRWLETIGGFRPSADGVT
jgi:enterochelin esterase-like enzyme